MKRSKRHAQAPGVETLESLTLLSGTPALEAWQVHARPVSVEAQAVKVSAAPLSGTVRGGFSAWRSYPGAVTFYTLGAAGRLAGIGSVGVNGTLQSLGSVSQGRATGNLWIQGVWGGIRLTLTGPVQYANSPLPRTFSYAIVGGTGSYRNSTGTGTVDVIFSRVSTVRTPVATYSAGQTALTFHPGATLPA